MEKWKLYDKIVKRAEDLCGTKWKGDIRLSRLMDVEFADQTFHLRLQDWLEADEINFIHDWYGILINLNREKKVFLNSFTPRFAGKEI